MEHGDDYVCLCADGFFGENCETGDLRIVQFENECLTNFSFDGGYKTNLRTCIVSYRIKFVLNRPDIGYP